MCCLLQFGDNSSHCHLTFTAAMESDRSYKSSINGFTVCVNIVCDCQFELDKLLLTLADYNVDIEIL